MTTRLRAEGNHDVRTGHADLDTATSRLHPGAPSRNGTGASERPIPPSTTSGQRSWPRSAHPSGCTDPDGSDPSATSSAPSGLCLLSPSQFRGEVVLQHAAIAVRGEPKRVEVGCTSDAVTTERRVAAPAGHVDPIESGDGHQPTTSLCPMSGIDQHVPVVPEGEGLEDLPNARRLEDRPIATIRRGIPISRWARRVQLQSRQHADAGVQRGTLAAGATNPHRLQSTIHDATTLFERVDLLDTWRPRGSRRLGGT